MISVKKFSYRIAAVIMAVLLMSSCTENNTLSEETSSLPDTVQVIAEIHETETVSETSAETVSETDTETAPETEVPEVTSENETFTFSERVIVPKMVPDDLEWDKDLFENTIFVGDSVCRALYVYNDLLTTKQVAATGGGAARNIYDYTFKMEDHEFTLKEAAEYYKPDIFFLWMGINDINMTEKDVYADNLKNIAEDMISISPDSKVVILSMSPTADYHEWNANERILEYNAAAMEMCRNIDEEEIYYLDIQDCLSDSDGYLLPECDGGDGMHLSQMAYMRLLHYITAALEDDFFNSEEETSAVPETEAETSASSDPAAADTAEPAEELLPKADTVSYRETSSSDAKDLKKESFSAEKAYVRPLGRTFMKNGVRILSNTCSGVEFFFKGTSADITLTSSCRDLRSRAAVYLNGKIVLDTMLDSYEETFRVFESDDAQECIISVVKLSEAAYSEIGVKSIKVNSEYGIVPTPEKTRRIEFIGDSITCGYGIDAADQNEKFSTANENGEKTYAALTGKYFNADYNVIAWSGIGVYSSYTESSEPNQSYIMPSVYEKTAVGESDSKWDFSAWQPDLIVINLGTNDNVWTKGIEERVDLFGSAYYDFIKQVRKANPDAYIICSLGVLGNDLFPEIEKQVGLYSKNTGDDRIVTFEFDMQNGQADGFGSGYHPSEKTHQKMADKLIPFISELMGW